MATAEERSQIIALTVGMFGAAPGAAVLAELETVVDSGVTIPSLAEWLAGSAEFTGIYSADLSNEEFATSFVNNLVGDEVAAADIDWAVDYITAELNAGRSRASLIMEALGELAITSEDNELWGAAAARFNNQVEVATYYSVEAEVSGDSLAALQDVIANVTSDDSTVTDAIADIDGPTALTAALADLAAAQEAEADFLAPLELDTDLSGTADVDAGDAVEADVTTFYTNASVAMQTATAVTDFENRSVAVQDAAIADAVADAAAAVAAAAADAADGMTALLSALRASQVSLLGVSTAFAAAETAYDNEVIAFNAVNSTNPAVVGDAVGNLNFDGDEFGELDADGNLTVVYAELVDGEWELTEDGDTANVEIAGIADLYAETQDIIAAESALQDALDAVEANVDAIILAETGAFAVADNGTVFNEATGAVDLTQADAEVYETEAEADRGEGAAAVYTIDLAGAATTADTQTIVIGGTTVYTEAAFPATAAEIAADVIALGTVVIDGLTYAVAAVGGSTTAITLTATTSEDEDNDLAITGTATLPSVTTVQPTVEGVTPGATDPVDLSAVSALRTALTANTDLLADVAAFEEARELNNQLDELNEATAAARDVITDDVEDGGLGLNLLEGAQVNFTAENDVYLYAEGTDRSLSNFGTAGEDIIFFGGDFDLVALGDDDITDNVGSVANTEIFWEQVGANVVLYVEEEAFAGNSSAGAANDITTITLVGVDGEDLSFGDGFLAIA